MALDLPGKGNISLEISFPDGRRISISVGGGWNLLHPISEAHGQKAQRTDPHSHKKSVRVMCRGLGTIFLTSVNIILSTRDFWVLQKKLWRDVSGFIKDFFKVAQIHPHSLFQEIRILYSPLFETAMRNHRKKATFICAQNTLPPATCHLRDLWGVTIPLWPSVLTIQRPGRESKRWCS